MNYLIARKSTSEIATFIKEYPRAYPAQIAQFLNANPHYIRDIIKQYKEENPNLENTNCIDTEKFVLYLKNKNFYKSTTFLP